MSRTVKQPGQKPMEFMLPDVAWTPPTELPDLRRRGLIAIDTETKDDGLNNDIGPGWVYKMGHIAGVSMAVADRAVYIPISHPDTENFDREQVGRWVHDHVQGPDRIVFQNAPYDLGWMGTEWGIKPPEGRIEDTQAMAVTVDENRLAYGLDHLCRWQGVPGKDEGALRQAADAYGLDAKAHLHQLPARFVGAYAEQDAVATLGLHDKFMATIQEEETLDAYRLETDLIPMVLEMRRRGVRLDTSAAERGREHLLRLRDEALKVLTRNLAIGRDITMGDINSPSFKEAVFTEHNVPFPRLLSGRASFESEWMEKRDHWLPQQIARALKLHGAGEKFIGQYLLGYAFHGRLHAEIHSYRSDEGGTRTTRFSYSDPPLQQMPSRDPDIATIIRCCFLPEEGEIWGALDYNQQEYRLIVHFAHVCMMAGVEKAVAMYRDDPKTDFHAMVAELTKLVRRKAKDVNFAKAFGAGVPKFALMTGMSLEEAKETMGQYDQEMPFVSRLAEFCQNRAEKKGFLKLLDKARSHFDAWEPRWRDREREFQAPRGTPLEACSRQAAFARTKDENHPWFGQRLKRAFTHKAMNRLIQGSAARMTKLAMRACWREGYVPLIQMHDELDFSFSKHKQGQRCVEIMRDVVQLAVPVLVDDEYGPTWGDAKAKKDKDGRLVYDASWGAAQVAARIRQAPASKAPVASKKKKAPGGRRGPGQVKRGAGSVRTA